MSTVPWLSVLIPMYNVRDYLSACIDSVMAQWEPGIEVVLLDDASTDDTLALARAACQRHEGRLRLVQHGHNRGLSAARNTLLQHAHGAYVWFLDSDDLLMPGALTSLRSCIERDQPDLVLCDYQTFRNGGTLKERIRDRVRQSTFGGTGRKPGTDVTCLLQNVLEASQLHAWSKIARREVWAQAPFPEGRKYEDIAVISPLLQASKRWIYMPEVWVRYRVRSGSIATTPQASSQVDLVRSLVELHASVSSLPAKRLTPALRRALDRFCLNRLGVVARWQHDSGQALPTVVTNALKDMYPQGIRHALDQVTRPCWLQRGWRARRRLKRVGWLT